jgi:hypothetical protein
MLHPVRFDCSGLSCFSRSIPNGQSVTISEGSIGQRVDATICLLATVRPPGLTSERVVVGNGRIPLRAKSGLQGHPCLTHVDDPLIQHPQVDTRFDRKRWHLQLGKRAGTVGMPLAPER